MMEEGEIGSKPRLLVASAIPSELRRVLESEYVLIARATISKSTATGFAVAVTTSMDGADKGLMDFLPDLRVIACNGAGVEKIDLDEARRRGIAVCNTPDVVTEDTADFGISLIYAVSRRTVEADRFVRAGLWRNGKMTPSRRVFDKSLGIVGLGKVGRAVARRAVALGMTVRYTGPSRKDGLPYAYVADVGELAAVSDVLVLTCPGGEATRHIVNAPVIERLGTQGILINVARGSVVDEAALIDALQRNAIGGAGLDVFASEPNPDERLLAFENVVVSPHYAAITHETRAAIAADLHSNIRSFYAGGMVRNVAIR